MSTGNNNDKEKKNMVKEDEEEEDDTIVEVRTDEDLMVDEIMKEISEDWAKMRSEAEMSDRQANLLTSMLEKAVEKWSARTAKMLEESKESAVELADNEKPMIEYLRQSGVKRVTEVAQILEAGAAALYFEKNSGMKIENIEKQTNDIKVNCDLQIAQLSAEVESLKKTLKEKDAEIDELKKEKEKKTEMGEKETVKSKIPTPSLKLQEMVKLKMVEQRSENEKKEKKVQSKSSSESSHLPVKESGSQRANKIVENWLQKIDDEKSSSQTRVKTKRQSSSEESASNSSRKSSKASSVMEKEFAKYMRLNSLPDPEPFCGKSQENIDEFLKLFEMKFASVIKDPSELRILLNAKFLKDKAKKLFESIKFEKSWEWEKIKSEFRKVMNASRTSKMARAVDVWMNMTIKKEQSISKYLIEVDKVATEAFEIPDKQLDILKTQKLLQAAKRNEALVGLLSIKKNDKREGKQYQYLKEAAIQFEYDTKLIKKEVSKKKWTKPQNQEEKEEDEKGENQEENKKPVERPRAFACFNCGGRGHKAADCKKPRRVFKIEGEESRKDSKETVHILKQPVEVVIDSGAMVSVVSSSFFQKLRREASEKELNRVKELPPTKFAIFDVNRKKIEVDKIVELPVIVRNKEAMVKFQVIRNDMDVAILGTDAFDEFGIYLAFRDEKQNQVRAARKCRIPPKTVKLLQIEVENPDANEDQFMLISHKMFVPDGLCSVKGENKSVIKIQNDGEAPILFKKNAVIGMAEFGNWDEVEVQGRDQQEKLVNLVSESMTEDESGKERYQNVLHAVSRNGIVDESAKIIIREYLDLFAIEDSELTQTDMGEYEIEMISEKPIRQKPRPIPLGLQQEVAGMIQQMLDNQVIRESKSAFSSPVVLVKKKNGKLRMCIDYRKLNELVKTNAFPLPHIETTLQSLNHKRIFSTLDMLAGYWQLKLAENSKDKTAFAVLGKLFEFNVLPFGLTTSPAIFQSLMERMLGDLLDGCAFVYIDDLLIASETREEHEEHVRKVLEKLRTAGLKIKAEKCQFFRKEVEYLGHLLTDEGVKADGKKIERVREWPVPKNREQLQSFLGFCNYYRRYVFNYAKIVSPLTPLTSSKVAWIWEKPQEEAFNKLKMVMTEAPVLAQPDIRAAQTLEKPFVIFTDASSYGTGAVLAQLSDDGFYKPIAFASKSLTSAEKRYHITDQEALALVMALRRFKHFVYGVPVTVFTDHQPLTSLFSSTKLANRLLRWSLELQDYQLTIIYVKGKSNVVADALSRGAVKESVEMAELRANEVEMVKVINQVQNITQPIGENWRILLEQDELWKNLIEKLESGVSEGKVKIPGLKPKVDISDFTLVNGQLCKIAENGDKLVRVVPKEISRKLFEESHMSLLAGHWSGETTKKRLKKDFYWPKMGMEIEKWYRECKECLWGNSQERLVAPLKPYITSSPMEIVAVDLIEMGISSRGNKYILSIIDLFTKYASAIPIPNKKGETVTEALIENWMIREGRIPKILLSDQGLEFCNETMSKLLKMVGTEQMETKGYNSRENGAVERFNQTIVTILKKDLHIPAEWDVKLPYCVFSYNATPHETTGESPYFLLYGIDPKIPLETAREDEIRLHHMDTQEYKYVLAQELHQAHEAVREKARKEQEKYKKEFDKRTGANDRDYPQKGDRVLIKIPTEKGSSAHPKLTNEWRGPYRIVDCSQNSVEVVPVIGKYEKLKIPYDQVKKVPIEFVDMPIETKKRRGRKKSAKNIVQNITQDYSNQSYNSRSPTCACGSCRQTLKWKNGIVSTTSITVCAGIHAAKRAQLKLSEDQLMLWAQSAPIKIQDQIDAIFSFAKCSGIMEYLEDFEAWKVAVERTRFELNGFAKPQPVEIHAKVVVVAPKFERAKIMAGKDVVVVYIKDQDLATFFTNFEVPECRKLVVWVATKEDAEYFQQVKELIENRPRKMETVILPLPLNGKVEQLPSIVKLFKSLEGFEKCTIVNPEQIKYKNGISITVTVDGGNRMKHEELVSYLKSIRKAIPENMDWLMDEK